MTADSDPYTLQEEDDHRAFWADEVADRILETDPEQPIVIKGGISPSGVPHLGNVNEIMRGHVVAEVLRDRGHEVRQLFTTDDRDPLRKLPRKLADLDGNLVDLGDVDAGALGRNLGKPYTDIPDPFGCCDSYGDHFSNLIAESAELLGVSLDVVSNTDMYESGKFEDATRYLLNNADRAREVLAEYQDKIDEDYVPFNPICENCGKITETVTAVDVEGGTVDYVCTDMEAGDRTIEGCGHEGTATLRDGKLPWRFEWPAQWRVLGVDFEPFGKDHAEGSWPSGEDIARNVFEFDPPVPMVYEWFTLNGEPFSSSEGNVVLVSDVLEMLEPEVLRYFFTKDPSRARDFDISRLDQLVDEFDDFEALYFGERDGDERERELAERAYPIAVDGAATAVPESRGDSVGTSEALRASEDARPERASGRAEEIREERIRLPYTFAAVLGMTEDQDLREEIARREGHIPDDAPDWAVEDALARVERAREWARRTDNEFNYELKRREIPDVDLDENTASALDELADFVESEDDSEAIQGEIYETAKRHDIPVGDFFSVGYRLFFDEEQGPKLGPFLAKLDETFVVERLRRER